MSGFGVGLRLFLPFVAVFAVKVVDITMNCQVLVENAFAGKTVATLVADKWSFPKVHGPDVCGDR